MFVKQLMFCWTTQSMYCILWCFIISVLSLPDSDNLGLIYNKSAKIYQNADIRQRHIWDICYRWWGVTVAEGDMISQQTNQRTSWWLSHQWCTWKLWELYTPKLSWVLSKCTPDCTGPHVSGDRYKNCNTSTTCHSTLPCWHTLVFWYDLQKL